MRLTHEQLKAVNPHSSRLVTANAGSGKTHVLVGRVSRLLLSEVKPQKILCLTYTKAAAAEMQSRLYRTLGKWSVLDNEQLREAIQNLYDDDISKISPPIDFDLARQLFALALETPEGLKVQTIHAFCERILSRFPIEAGIMPGFDPFDDDQQRDIKADVKSEIFSLCANNKDPELTSAMQRLSLSCADQTLDKLFEWMANSPEDIRLWTESGGTKALADYLGLKNDISSEAVICQALEEISDEELSFIAEQLSLSPSSQDRDNSLLASSAILAKPRAKFTKLKSLFFTQKNAVKKSFYTKKAPESVKPVLDRIADIIIASEHTRCAAKTLELSQAVFIVSQVYAELYQRRKHDLRGLDFNDQILLVRNLLQKSEVSDWVSYKLDGGIEHILLDEAQDTSPEQWQIIDKLAEPFFSGKGRDRDIPIDQTLFAVGDEKQSIYSFQGADPQQFLDKLQYYERRSEMGEVKMQTSFRSAQEIMTIIDRILVQGGAMREMFSAKDYPLASDIVCHEAFRSDHGSVELWPIMPQPEKQEEKEPWDTTPIDALSTAHQRMKLARQIAKTVKMWIDQGEPVFDREIGCVRPINAGDVLVLVQKRNSFFDAIIREFKKESVPVAGADRLKLKDALIVKDLLSLARFVLLPSDDLSLAEVLKSPIIGFDDAQLFNIAVDRDASLWEALQDRAPEIAKLLSAIMGDGLTMPPYDFYSATLDRVDGVGETIRKKFFRRLSMEAREALDAFLARAMDQQYRRSSSLHHFVKNFADNNVEIKRDMDSAKGMARVMTVHGAKGLEAPIVFLPDTTSLPKDSDRLVPMKDGFVWKPSSKDQIAALQTFYEANQAKMMREQLRLLYVAVTRAESRLIVCGYHNGSKTETGYLDTQENKPYKSWYAWIKAAFETLDTDEFEPKHAVEGQGLALRYGAPLTTAQKPDSSPKNESSDLPPWARDNVVLSKMQTSLSPSRLKSTTTAKSPLTRSFDASNYLRGNLTHKLLEVLPNYSQDEWKTVGQKITTGYRSLANQVRKSALMDVLNILKSSKFSELFNKGSMSEVAVTGTAKSLPDGVWMNGQIDRLCVTETGVLIVDYKSDRNPPSSVGDVSADYVRQMASYKALIEEIYPDRDVKCALLWTRAPKLMPLPAKLLDEALQSLEALPKSSLRIDSDEGA